MKNSELELETVNYTMSANIHAAKSHYKFVMRLGRAFPSTKEQAKYFLSSGAFMNMDVLNWLDVQIIEKLLTKHGFEGDYKYTKSKTWVRIVNTEDLKAAI